MSSDIKKTLSAQISGESFSQEAVLSKFELKMGVATREAYGQALVELVKKNPNVVALDADLAKSTFSAKFQKEFPDRFFTCGIAEANMVGIAGGLALSGKLPFASAFAVFLCDKGYDQLRMCVAYPGVNAKFVGSHGGISIGEDGPSQQAVEDYAIMCALAGFVVLSPSDEFCARALVHRMAEHTGPVYMRTIKPIDEAAIAQAAKECGAIVSAEEHLLDGGLGSQVARAVAKTHPVPMEFVGGRNTYAV